MVVDASRFYPATAPHEFIIEDSSKVSSFDEGHSAPEIMINQQSFNKKRIQNYAIGQPRHNANQPSTSSMNKSINASAISQGSSTLGGPADKYR